MSYEYVPAEGLMTPLPDLPIVNVTCGVGVGVGTDVGVGVGVGCVGVGVGEDATSKTAT